MNEIINITPNIQTAMMLALLASMWTMVRSMMKRSADRNDDFDMLDFVTERDPVTKKRSPSVLRAAYIGAFSLCSWIMVMLTLTKTMTVEFFMGFGALFVLPLTAYMIWGKHIPPEILSRLGIPATKPEKTDETK